jgi:plasmid stabilization system protein ParE
MKIFWSEHALLCLRDISDFISEDNPVAADKLTIKILTLTESLIDNPKFGRVVPEKRDTMIREILYKNYRIIYRLTGMEIHILSFLEGSRLLKEGDYK